MESGKAIEVCLALLTARPLVCGWRCCGRVIAALAFEFAASSADGQAGLPFQV